MLQDREEGELSSEEADGAEMMKEAREDLEEGEVDEGEHPTAAGHGQAQFPGEAWCFCCACVWRKCVK